MSFFRIPFLTHVTQPYEEPVSSDDASGAEDDVAAADVEIEDPASNDVATDADADDVEEEMGSPSFGNDVLEGDEW